MKYKVTIGIPAYNAEGFVERGLNSALNQSFPDIEFIVVNDGSVDNTRGIIESFIQNHPRGKDIRFVNNERNLGLSASRNIMINEAQGEYICFLDIDDEMPEDAVQIFYNLMQSDPVDFIVGSYLRVNENKKVLQKFVNENDILIRGELKLAEAYFSARSEKELIPIPACIKFFKVSFLRKNNILFPVGYVYEDSLFTYQIILKANSCRIIPNITYLYYIISSSITEQASRHFSRAHIDSCLHLIKSQKDICKEYIESPIFELLVMNTLASHYYLFSFIYQKKNRDQINSTDFKIALSAYPLTLKNMRGFSLKNKLKGIGFMTISHSPVFVQRLITKLFT